MLKKTVVSLVIGGSLLGGVASAGTAYAAAPSTTSTSATAGSHAARAWLRAHRREIRKAGIDISAKTIGVTPKVLVTDLRAGQSVADVATAHGVSASTVVAALVKEADTAVAKAESDHKLTSAQASKIEAALPARITKAVDRTRAPRS